MKFALATLLYMASLAIGAPGHGHDNARPGLVARGWGCPWDPNECAFHVSHFFPFDVSVRLLMK